ncbi:filamin-A isoform X2 [Metopolophium dirhodum]|uniref:filamin-A isoform X2 n=1 Tax=Metopolophium dirhodum TaxID=44670 RepID=UPI00298FA7F1|nr:filamin-A isoform X2 [Metopolophium dirhodum]
MSAVAAAAASAAATATDDPDGYEAGSQEDDMGAAERDLAEDARWKLIQQNTFTRWANEHLKTAGKAIGNLETDLGDGLRLIALIEVLSGKRLPKHNKRPTFRSQKLENVSVALKFLDDENIKLVNIDSSDIVDCKLKLILGLIWTLILHYSISMPMWDGEFGGEQVPNEKGATPKQRLLNWIQSKVPDIPISNFTTDWNDGKAVGALVDAVAPGLCPDWQDWKSNNALKNASEAMGLADDWLNIKQLIKPEELVSPNMDEQSMMTYLSQYPNAKLKQGAPIRSKTNPSRVRVYGPGIEPSGPAVGAKTNFTVETFSAGKGTVNVSVENPKGKAEPVDLVFNNDRSQTYTATYKPVVEGPHKVHVNFSGVPTPKSPYHVNVDASAGDPNKVNVFGPGIQPEGVFTNRPTYFEIHTKDAGKGVPEVIILDPAGRENTIPVKLKKEPNGVYICDYTPVVQGVHSVNVFFANQPVPLSPFAVGISNASDAKRVRAFGRGIQPHGLRVQDEAKFKIVTEGAGEGVPDVNVIGPGGVKEPVNMKKLDAHTYEATYYPRKVGRHVVMVTFGGVEIPKAPFEVHVNPFKETLIRAYGPGLTGGVVSHPAMFTVETNGETGSLGFSIEGPSKAKIDCQDNGDGSADVRYYPMAPGEYAVHILCDNEDIPKSPYMANVVPSSDFYPDKVNCYGSGLQPNGVIQGKPAEFVVDTKKAGVAPLDVKVIDSGGNFVEPMLKDNKDGTFSCKYVPKSIGKHTLQVSYGGVAVPKSPFRVFVSQPLNANKVQIFGPGIESGVKTNKPNHFTIDCSDAGIGELNVNLVNDKGVNVPLQVNDNEDGSFLIDYVPTNSGVHNLNCTYGGVKVPDCPIKINVQSPVDLSKVKVDGLETLAPVNSLQQFRVMTREAGRAEFAVVITGPSGGSVTAHVVPVADGYVVNFTPTEVGEYRLSVTLGGEQAGRPYRMTCTRASDPGKVTAHGPGLAGGPVNRPAEFTIDTKRAGQGGLGVTVEGPCEAAINCRDNGDGTCSVAYMPVEAGHYVVNITFDDHPIPGSPFNALVGGRAAGDAPRPPNNVKASGNGLLANGVLLGSPTDFSVDSRAVAKYGQGVVTCTVTNPSGTRTETFITPQSDGTYKISYTPFEAGPHTIDIYYDGVPIVGSPFSVNVRRGTDASKCRAFGPGVSHGIIHKVNTFTVETKGAGTGSLGLAIEGPSEAKMTCVDNRDGSCTIEYMPTESGVYDVSIQFAETHIPGSPFKVQVDCPDRPATTNDIKVSGPGINPKYIRANTPITFKVDASKSAKGHVDVKIGNDKGVLQPKQPIIRDNEDGTYDVTYTPNPEGALLVANVLYNGHHVPNSPFKLRVRPKFELDKIKIEGPGVSDSRGIKASVPTYFVVDATDAGSGKLDLRIMGPDGFPRQVDIEKKDNLYKIKYTPDDCGRYTIEALYDGKPLPQSPIQVQAYSTGNVTEDTVGVKRLPRDFAEQLRFDEYAQQTITTTSKTTSTTTDEYRPVALDKIPVPSCGGHLTADIAMPSGKRDQPSVEDNHDGTVSLKYDPKEEGLHELFVKYNGENVQGSPFKFHVDSITSGHITAYGPGLMHGVSGEPSDFTIYTKGAGAGGLSLAVEGPSKADISCHDNKDGTVSVTYLPTAPGEYRISVKFEDKHIKGSPYNTKVTGEGRKRNQISVGSCSEVSLPGKVLDKDFRLLNASIQAPSGLEEPCFLKRLVNGNLGISFTPREIGQHVVSVKRMGQHIVNSPFKITVGEREVGDAKKVKVTGNGLKEGKTHVENLFTVDTRSAGYGGLSLSIEGPSKAEIQCKDNEDGTLTISYRPTEPGYYIVNLKFADHHVDGSPFTVKVTGEGSNCQREKIERRREAVPLTEVGSNCKLTFKMPGVLPYDLSSTVTSPCGITEDAEINEIEDGLYAVHFVPKELGVHTVSVRYKEVHIPGSPFQFTVGPMSDGGAHRVHAGGSGLERGEQGQPCEFNVWTREAGPGSLAISVEGPSKAEIDFKDRKDGSCYVSYVVGEPGEYRIGIKFNDQHIPDSPYKLFMSPAMGDAHKLEVAQFPTSGVQADYPAQFMVRKNGAVGQLDAKVVSPSGAEDDCFIQSIDQDMYSVRFMPRDNGVHNIHVKFNGVHIPGSPYRLKVGKGDADPAAVHATGSGLGDVKTGHKTDFIVDTCNAGAGTLAVTIDGPSKVSMDCTEVEEGYKVRYTPLVPGEYYISLKYNGYHIVGSPFKVTCTGEDLAERGPQETSSVVVETVHKVSKAHKGGAGVVLPHFKSNATLVTSKGMGLKKAYVGKQNLFSISASDAGNNILFVGIYGPKGPCEEIFIKHMKQNNYQVSYIVRERGEYILLVKWGDDHIPGSPFKIDT